VCNFETNYTLSRGNLRLEISVGKKFYQCKADRNLYICGTKISDMDGSCDFSGMPNPDF